MDTSILVIEDDLEFADYLRRGLTYEGYQVQITFSAEEGIAALQTHQPDIVVLDVMLPGLDGMAACHTIRQSDYRGPILMLTARNAVDDRVAGLDAGADDYLGKPFDFDELLARLRALLRRHAHTGSVTIFSDLELDKDLYAVRRHGEALHLSRIEYDLLAFFLTNPQRVLTRDSIIDHVWGSEHGGHENSLDVYISRLRRKLGNPSLIHTIHGVGYILREETR